LSLGRTGLNRGNAVLLPGQARRCVCWANWIWGTSSSKNHVCSQPLNGTRGRNSWLLWKLWSQMSLLGSRFSEWCC